MQTLDEARAYLSKILSEGAQRAQTTPEAPHGSYPRITSGYLVRCLECGSWSVMYTVDNGMRAEDRGYISCPCFTEG